MEKTDNSRYDKHILLNNIGMEGQKKILRASVLVIGCGGLGNSAIPLLAAAGTGYLTLVDDDRIDLSNLHRQIHYTPEDVGRLKVDVLSERIKKQNPAIHVTTVPYRLNFQDLTEKCIEHDIILDCSDNYETRMSVNKASVLSKKPLVFGSAIRGEGQVTVFDPRRKNSPCFACLFGGSVSDKETSDQYGVFSPLVSIIGAMQAAETIKLITGSGSNLVNILMNYDAINSRFYSVTYERSPDCPVCGTQDNHLS